MTRLLIICSLSLLSSTLFAQDVYKVILTRAAPGELKNLIEHTKQDLASHNPQNPNGYLLRHSQGDQWDLMTVVPVKDLKDYFSNKSVWERNYGSEYYNLVAWQEEGFAQGPTHDEFEAYFSENSFFHIEMFVALPGKQNELKKEREMENTYLEKTGRKPNFIFTRLSGFKYDNFTIGAYKSLIAYAEGGNQPEEVQEKAAVESGFKSASDIGFYLRALISEHHDTLANKVN